MPMRIFCSCSALLNIHRTHRAHAPRLLCGAATERRQRKAKGSKIVLKCQEKSFAFFITSTHALSPDRLGRGDDTNCSPRCARVKTCAPHARSQPARSASAPCPSLLSTHSDTSGPPCSQNRATPQVIQPDLTHCAPPRRPTPPPQTTHFGPPRARAAFAPAAPTAGASSLLLPPSLPRREGLVDAQVLALARRLGSLFLVQRRRDVVGVLLQDDDALEH